MKLLDICEAIVDCPHSTAKNDGTGYPLIRTPNVGKGRLKLAGVHRVSENVYNLRNERAVPQVDDLILAREAPVGNVAIIRQGQQVCLGQRTVLIRPNKECVDPDFLVYYLLSPKLQHNLLSSANGATVSHLNMSSIRSLEVQVPDIEVQKRIGAILARIDDKIELNTAINENFGHNCGDIAIKAIADAVLASTKNNEICARIGGDEFVVIGCNDYNDNYPERFSARVNDRLRVYNKFAGNEFEVSVSIGGICKHITDIHELEDMFTQADKIMYASKLERHKNRK